MSLLIDVYGDWYSLLILLIIFVDYILQHSINMPTHDFLSHYINKLIKITTVFVKPNNQITKTNRQYKSKIGGFIISFNFP